MSKIATPPLNGRRPDWVWLAGLLFLVFLVHSQVLGFGFAYDDFWTILDNSYLHGPYFFHGLWDGTAAGLHVPDAGRPVMVALHGLEWRVFGAWAPGYHLVSLLLHLANTALLAVVASELMGSGYFGLAAAALFGLHPVQAEAVSVVSFREDLLVGLFGLVFWLCVLQARRVGKLARFGLGLAGFVTLFGALGSKESGAILLVAVPLATALATGKGLWTEIRSAWPVYLGGLAALGLALLLRLSLFGTLAPYSGPVYPHPGDLWGAPLGARVQVAIQSLGLGWQTLWLPVGLSPEYCPIEPGWWWVPFGLLLAGWLAAALRARRWLKALVTGLAWGLATALPTSNLFWMPNTSADRFWYVPSWGWSLAATSVLWALAGWMSHWAPWSRGGPVQEADGPRIPSKRLGTFGVLVVLVLVGFAVAARVHGEVYRDDDSLWAAAARQAPCSARALTGHAATLVRRGALVQAQAVLSRVLSRRRYPPALVLRAAVLRRQGRLRAAEADLLAALSSGYWEPWRVWTELAEIALERRDPTAALRWAMLASLHAPDRPAAQFVAFRAVWETGQARAAARHLARALGDLFR